MTDGRITIDLAMFPVVLVTISGAPSREQYEVMFDDLEASMPKGTPYVAITDARMMTRVLKAPDRQWMADRSDALEESLGGRALARFVIVDSAIVRGALTAVNWLMKAVNVPVGNLDDALARSEAALRSAGIPIPQNLRAARLG